LNNVFNRDHVIIFLRVKIKYGNYSNLLINVIVGIYYNIYLCIRIRSLIVYIYQLKKKLLINYKENLFSSFNQTIVDCVYFLVSSTDIKTIDFYIKPFQLVKTNYLYH